MGRRSLRVSLALALAAVPLAGLMAPAQVAPMISLNPTEGEPGETVDVTGSGFGGGEVALFLDTVHPDNILAIIMTRSGDISGSFVIPNNVGPHRVLACNYPQVDEVCRSDIAEAPLTILAPPPTTTTTKPPSTTSTQPPDTTTTTFQIAIPSSTTTSSLVLGASTTTTKPDPPAPSGPTGVAFTTTSTSLDLPSGFTNSGDDYFPDLEITDVEVTQGIQDLQNRMPLVAGKETIVRVYVAADKIESEGLGGVAGSEPEQTIGPEGWEPVDGLLYLRRGGEELYVYPMNAPITAYRTGSDRLDEDQTLNFVLPDEWLHGEVDITAVIWSFLPQNIHAKEPDAGNNFAEGTVVFRDAEAPITIWWRLDTAVQSLTDGEYSNAVSAATESYTTYHPVAVPNFWPVWAPLGPGEIFGDDPPPEIWDLTEDKGAPNARMYWLYVTWNADGLVRFHGLVDINESSGGTAGLTSSSMKVAWSKPTETTPAHEGAHMFGIKHAPCQDNDDDGLPDEVDGGGWGWIDQTYPSGLPSCSIAPEDPSGYYGTRVTDDHLGWRLSVYSNNQALPNVRYPFMGYEGAKWVDAYHYCLLMETYDIYCNPASIGLTPKTPPGPPVDCGPPLGGGIALDLCLWNGAPDVNQQLGPIGSIQWAVPVDPPDGWVVVDVDTGDGVLGHAAILEPAQHLESQFEFLRERAKSGGYANNAMLRLTDLDGHVIVQVPVSTEFAAHNDAGDGIASVELIPWYDEAASMDLLIGDQVVASKQPTSPPEVTIDEIAAPTDRTVTVSWTGSDPDGDDLVYTLLWSAGDAETWQVVDTGFTGSTATLTDDLGLPGGEVWVKVIASDGFSTAFDVEGPVTVPAGEPYGVLVAPEQIAQHSPARMTFHVIDPEDGVLESGSWASDVDGPLGEGRTMWTRFLSLGVHEISLTASDSDGNEVTLSQPVEVVAGELAPPRLPGDVPDAEMIAKLGPAALDQLVTTETVVPADDDGNGESSPAIVIAVLSAFAAVLVVLWTRARRNTDTK